MIGIIITGHGKFASGLLSAVEVIAGKQQNVQAIDFLVEDSSEGLWEKIAQAAKEMNVDGILFLTDISGGTPFNTSVLVSKKLRLPCHILSGTNMPLIIEAAFSRDAMLLDDLVSAVMHSEQVKVQLFTEKEKASTGRSAGGI